MRRSCFFREYIYIRENAVEIIRDGGGCAQDTPHRRGISATRSQPFKFVSLLLHHHGPQRLLTKRHKCPLAVTEYDS